MIIDDIKYKLPSSNYIPIESIKQQIIIGHTFNHNMRHYFGFLNRYNGKNKKTSSFTIDVGGTIYQHFDPIYQSNFFNNIELDNKSIVILLENDGFLSKINNVFFTWLLDIYRETDVVEKKWRDHTYWVNYSEKQIKSTIMLINKLCDDFSIKKNVINHNTKIDDISNYEGILYRSNLDKNYTDLNPSWPFEKFKELVETTIDVKKTNNI